MIFTEFRSREIAEKLAGAIRSEARRVPRKRIRIMHVCGTHEETVSRFGIRSMLPEEVEIIPGPGCPVCVTTSAEIEEARRLALRQGCVVTTFGDLLKVPAIGGESLADAKAAGGDVRVVYSIFDAVRIALREPEKQVVHVAIGFETTAPSTAALFASPGGGASFGNMVGSGEEGVPENFSVLVCHRRIPPAMDLLLRDPDLKIDGFINPGHVSTIIGLKPYEELAARYGVPQVVSGFEPVDVLISILMLLREIIRGGSAVENEYSRVVKREGNRKALAAMDEVFEPCDAFWRGFPIIPRSGLRLRERFERYDARKRFGLRVEEVSEPTSGCICGEVLKGKAYPDQCPLFGKECTPAQPVGACMVSSEGSCGIWIRYGRY